MKTLTRYRFTGTKAYKESDNDIFFGRETEIRDLFHKTGFDKATILHSEAGAGKSSLIRAGLIYLLKSSKQFDVFYINFTPYNTKSIYRFVEDAFPDNKKLISYLDKVIDKKDGLWYNIKRFHDINKSNKKAIIILDGFENFFTYPIEEQKQFNIELSSILYEPVPADVKTELKTKIANNPELLSSEASQSLFKPLNCNVLFSLRTKNIENIKSLNHFYPDALKNTYKLNLFNEEQARNVLVLASRYESKYADKNNFEAPAYDISENLVEEAVDYLKNEQDEIYPKDLQVICKYIEKQVNQRHIKTVDKNNLLSFSDIFKVNYNKILSEITETENKERLKNLIENGLVIDEENKLISLYNGFIKSKFKINGNVLNYADSIITTEINEKGEIYRRLVSNKYIPVIAELKKEQKHAEQKAKQEAILAIKLKNEAENQLKKTKKIKIIAISVFFALIVAVLGLFWLNNVREQAVKREALAKSSLFSAYAFREIKTNPTKAFSFAEKAYTYDKTNIAAHSALINSYYSAGAFYLNVKNLDKNTIAAKLSRNSKYFISVVKNKKQKNFEAILYETTGKELFRFKHNKIISFVGFSNDAKYILLGDYSGNIFILDKSGEIITKFKAHKSAVWSIKIAPSGNILTSGGDQKISLWTRKGEFIKDLPKHDFDVYATTFSSDGRYIATADDNVIHVCDSVGNLIKELPVPKHKSYYYPLIQSIEFSNDSKNLLLAINDMNGKNHSSKIIDINGNDIMVFRGHKNWINYAHFSQDNKSVITSSRDNSIRVYKITGELEGILRGHSANVFDANFNTDGRIFSVSSDRTVKRWSFGKLLNPLSKTGNVRLAMFTPGGFNILTATDSTAKLTDISGELKAKYMGNKKAITSVGVSPDGTLVATGGRDKKVRVWNVQGKLQNVFSGHKKKINSIAFSPDSNFVISASDDSTVVIWDTKRNSPKKLVKTGAKVRYAEFSPSNKTFLAALSSGKIILFNNEGKKIKEFPEFEDAVVSAKFSPDGKKIISLSKDKSAEILSISGQKLNNFSVKNEKFNTIEFSSDGNLILAACNDKSVRVYESNGKEVVKLDYDANVKASHFSDDGNYIITVLSDKNSSRAKIQVISPDKILELVNDVKIFGEIDK